MSASKITIRTRLKIDSIDSIGPVNPINTAAVPIVQAIRLSKKVGADATALTILDDVSFDIEAGDAVAILGVSGSGKSTLLGLLAGLDTPSDGKVVLGGRDLFALDEDGRAALRGQMAGFVFQSFQLLPALTALENVMLPLELAAHPKPDDAARALLGRVGLGERLGHYPKQLSGGEQQRVAIARAFAGKPKIVFADEPTGNLDAATGAEIIDLMFKLNRENQTTLVLVTHDEALAQRCSRRLRLAAGRLISGAVLQQAHA
ncbi:MAG: ABC transporter ATP-binding protein [Burkholderiales bacterium]|nr:ABC transporter ATP-binding protein [Burkholderiales bacterium]